MKAGVPAWLGEPTLNHLVSYFDKPLKAKRYGARYLSATSTRQGAPARLPTFGGQTLPRIRARATPNRVLLGDFSGKWWCFAQSIRIGVDLEKSKRLGLEKTCFK